MISYTIGNICPVCHEKSEVIVPLNQWQDYIHDISTGGPKRHAQNAFPDLSPAEREIIITGTHSKCWDKIFDDEA